MGHDPSTHPPSGVAGDITPAQAKKFFEFFPRGSSFQVLLLGPIHEQLVHWIQSKGHKVICNLRSREGRCHNCEVAAESRDVSTRQVEYWAPAFVRPMRQKQFDQRVAVFTASAGQQVVSLLAGKGLAERGQVIEIESVPHNKGKGHRYKVKLLPGLEPALAAALPPAFSTTPFLRARFGRPQLPGEPMVFLAPFKELARSLAFTLPQPLPLTASDYERPSDEERQRIREILARGRERMDGEEPEPVSAPTPGSKPAPPKALIEPAIEVPEPAAPRRAAAADRHDDPPLLGELDVFTRATNPAAYGPRLLVRPSVEDEAEPDSVPKLCNDLKAQHAYLGGKRAPVNGKAGAK